MAVLSTSSIFDTLAQQDTQKIQHDQGVAQSADVFDKLAANNGQPPDANTPKGPSIGPAPKASDVPTFGYDWQPPEQRMTMPLAKVLMAAHDKLKEAAAFTQEGKAAHPVQAKLGEIADRIEGFLFGGATQGESKIGTGETGMLTNPVMAALLPGAEGEPALAGAIRGGASLVKSGAQVVKGAISGGEEGPGIVKQVLQGKEVAQAPAKTAVRTATGAAEDASLLEGNKSIVDKPIQKLFTQERAAYAKQDKIAGFDMRALQDKLENTQERISNLTDTEEDVAMEAKLEKSRTAIMDKIQEAEGKLKQAGVDPEEAKSIYQQRKAGEDFKKAIVQHVSSDGESINVDGLLQSAKKLRFNKYGDRLEQFMGADGANQFMANLERAQKSGVHAMKVQQVAKWVGGIAGLSAAGAGIHAVKQVAQ